MPRYLRKSTIKDELTLAIKNEIVVNISKLFRSSNVINEKYNKKRNNLTYLGINERRPCRCGKGSLWNFGNEKKILKQEISIYCKFKIEH